jgi:hypothetical protein
LREYFGDNAGPLVESIAAAVQDTLFDHDEDWILKGYHRAIYHALVMHGISEGIAEKAVNNANLAVSLESCLAWAICRMDDAQEQRAHDFFVDIVLVRSGGSRTLATLLATFLTPCDALTLECVNNASSRAFNFQASCDMIILKIVEASQFAAEVDQLKKSLPSRRFFAVQKRFNETCHNLQLSDWKVAYIRKCFDEAASALAPAALPAAASAAAPSAVPAVAPGAVRVAAALAPTVAPAHVVPLSCLAWCCRG